MSKIEILTLKGKSRKGKNRIQELGTEWLVLLARDEVSFSTHRRPGGGWLLIAPKSNTEKIRWIMRVEDPDFSVEASVLVED
jgi:hypothetical protein